MRCNRMYDSTNFLPHTLQGSNDELGGGRVLGGASRFATLLKVNDHCSGVTNSGTNTWTLLSVLLETGLHLLL